MNRIADYANLANFVVFINMVAEKLEAMVVLAGFNSRMKDYFDL